jgi:hypothetical protein
MNNPYTILGLSQDADDKQIARSQIAALRARRFSMNEITAAQAALRKPATRLAADFTFPIIKKESLPILESSIKSKKIDLDSLNVNKYDSLK